MQKLCHQFWLTGSTSLLCLVTACPTQAQISPDATLGTESSAVTSNVVINGILSDRIDGGAIRGANLFHSFREFNVDEIRGAYFTNPAGIENILSRVTGGSRSDIQGTLGVLGNANLFLINPNGMIFGPNARLDVRGSFLASTTSSINFADGTPFSATTATLPLLTVSVPLGLQFGRNGDIRVQGSFLSVRPGETLALVGGDVVLEGAFLAAENGRIELGSVASGSLVSLTQAGQDWRLGYEGVQNFGDVQLSQEAFVSTSGPGGGDIQIRGGSVTLTEGSLVAAAAQSSTGAGGNLTIEARRLIIQDGAQAFTSTEGAGEAGELTVRAAEVELVGISKAGSPSGLFSTTRARSTLPASPSSLARTRGNLTIETEQLTIRDGAQVAVTTFSARDAGDLTVRASEVRLIGAAPRLSQQGLPILSGLFAGTEPGTTGSGGNLTIETERLIVQDGAEAQASTLGDGAAGSLIVRASESVELSGRPLDSRFPTGLLAVSGLEGVSTATGSGGDLRIETGQLIVQDSAAVTVSAAGAGEAGDLSVTARSIELNDEGALIAETASGAGGNITLQAQDIRLRRESNISTTAGTQSGPGNGGTIAINTDTLVGLENSDITANAFEGTGGTIDIRVEGIFGLVQLDLEDLQTLLETEDPNELNPRRLLSSDITAISQTDPSLRGQVTINTPDVDPSQGLVALPTDFVDASGLIAQNCPSNGGTAAIQSEFIVTGRGGLPPSPSDALSSQAVWQDLRPPARQVANRSGSVRRLESDVKSTLAPSSPIVEAQGWVIDADGQVILTAAPTVTPQNPWARSGCLPHTVEPQSLL